MHSEGDTINIFYNLKGVHINERKKHFYTLLKTSANPALLLAKPRNFLEKIFYLDILIYYRETDKLLEILQEGIGVFTSRILKEKWFFQEVFQQKNEADIVNIFLPTLSCSLRGKVLLKMANSLTEEKMDKIIILVIERYGIYVAQQILFSCSEDMIRKIINNYDIHLYPVHLKRLLNKNPLLIKFYFEKYLEFQGREYSNDDFLNYLCWKKPELYFDMGLNKNQYVKLGKRTTKMLLKIREQDVINNTTELDDIKLHLGQLARQITDFGKQCLPKLLPKNLHFFKNRCTQKLVHKILIKYPCNKRWHIMSEAFSLAYNKNIVEYLDYFQSDIILLFNVEIRRQWSNLMYTKTNDTKYCTYMDPEEFFKLIKAKINVTSAVRLRIEFLNKLVNICHVNNDYKTYGEALKYITQRHRNDDLNSILRSISSNYNPNDFTDFHWKYISEMLEIVRTKGSIIPSRIFLDYLLYSGKYEISFDDTVKWFVSDSMERYINFDFNIKGQPDVWIKVWKKAIEVAAGMEKEKRALSKVINLIITFNKENKSASIDLSQYEAAIKLFQNTCQLKEHYDDEDYQIIRDLLTYNNQKPHTLIRVCDDDQLLAVIKILSRQHANKSDLISTVSDIVSKQNRTNFEEALLHYFVTEWFDNIPCYMKHKNKTMRYLARNDPEITNTYFDLFLKYDTNDKILDFRLLKNYSHLEFDQKFIKYHSGALAKIHIHSYSYDSRILKGLALLMSSDNFLNLVSGYLPKKTKLDLKNYEINNTYDLQCVIIKLFQQVEDPVKVIPYLSRVCHEDFLQSSLVTMYNILNRINESGASHFIDTLKNQPLSLRKHSVFLAFNYMPLHFAIDVYMSVSAKEKNVSMKKHFLASILKVFMKNPVEFVMDIVLSKIDTVDKDDDESLNKLVETVNNIPNRFRAAFIEKLWRTLDKFADDANKYRYQIIEGTQRCFCKVVFTEAFCKDVIGKHFLSVVGDNKSHCNYINKIVLDYLRTNDSQRFDFVFEIVRTFKENNWKWQNQDTKEHLYNFFDVALSKLIIYDANVLLQFETYWKRIFSATEHFLGFCSLELLKLFKDCAGNTRMFAEGIDSYFQNVILTYGPHVNLLLTKCLQSFCTLDNSKIRNCLLEDVTVDLLSINVSPLNHFIGMNVVRNVIDDEKKNQIIQLLARQHDPLSQILYYSLFQ